MFDAVEKARNAWQGAPFHVRAMAGAYVAPILAALLEMEGRIFRVESALSAKLKIINEADGAKNGA